MRVVLSQSAHRQVNNQPSQEHNVNNVCYLEATCLIYIKQGAALLIIRNTPSARIGGFISCRLSAQMTFAVMRGGGVQPSSPQKLPKLCPCL